MFLLCLIAHLCPLKSLDYRINGAFEHDDHQSFYGHI